MILLWLILIPFIGGLLCWLTGNMGLKVPRVIALLSTLLLLVLSIWLWWTGTYSFTDPTHVPVWSDQFQLAWIPRFGISIHLALDGFGLLMVVLTGVVGLLSVVCAWHDLEGRNGAFYFNLLLLLTTVVGIFLAVDLFLFFFFWEVMLIPMYFLISLWGFKGSDRQSNTRAAVKFFIYTQSSGLLMLLAIIGLVFVHYSQTGVITFDYDLLLGTHVGGAFGMVLMLGFFIAFAVKLPVVPFHGWMPDAHAHGPSAGSLDLAGIMIKTAGFGLLRFALPLFPEQSALFAPVAMVLGLISIYYGAVMAFAQKDIKRLLAYSTISHMGFVLIAIYSGSTLALQGSVVLMIASALSGSALFIISGGLYNRLKTRDMSQMGGLFGRVGALSGFSLAFAMASLGIPGTANFIGEFLILFGAFGAWPWVVVLASIGLVLASVYALTILHRIYYGEPKIEGTFAGLSVRETFMLGLALVLLLFVGFYPQLVLNASLQPMTEIAQWFSVPTLLQ
ncbi:NADH-quinone oxidoreductase subunit M [Halomonadaceae bacterium LMG 33818]|uniref:NADH-quinone oxidoreductase subunit M n=1 Tax=Cernens ardua TaxID=3402176 RepID=UPI003EDC0EF7